MSRVTTPSLGAPAAQRHAVRRPGVELKEIETGRLRLRPLTPGDRDALYTIYADPEVSRYLLTKPRSMQEFCEPFQQMVELASTLGMWTIIHKADNCVEASSTIC